MDEKQYIQLIERLDAISKSLILNLPDKINQSKVIQLLSESGMSPKNIASVVGTTNNAVSVVLNRLKSEKPKKRSSKK